MSVPSTQRRWQPTDLGVAGPSPRDMLRAFTAIRADPIGFLSMTQQRYGDTVAFPVPGPPVLLINNPTDIRQVLQVGASHWGKNTVQYLALARVTGPGLLASADPSWITHRRAAAPAFHHQRLEAVAVHVRAAAQDGIAAWQTLPGHGAVVDVAPLMLGIALDVVGRALFSADLSSRSDRLVAATSDAARLIVAIGRSVLPLPPWLPTSTNRRLKAATHELNVLCGELIDRRRHASGAAHGDDLLGLLIDGGLSDSEIRDELVTMVVAGHETVAAAMTWTLMLLAENEPAQEKVRQEVRQYPGHVPMIGSLSAAPWMRAVIDESLRLFPPAWVISRRTTEPDTLNGVTVPAGTLAIISPWLVHRRPQSWPSPHDFRPDRFIDGESTIARPDYIPFGFGPRLCIGREFALGEMVIVLAELMSSYRIQTPAAWLRPRPRALVAVHPDGGMALHVAPLSHSSPRREVSP